ncbi:MAG TPA: glycosyltransferase [Burkholderiaceae bacterium]|nr:glycosyltransferase [Burkholderiaceae bacterium]
MSRIRIGFVLPSNTSRPLPSTRIAVLNMMPFLAAAGFDPQVVYEPATETERPHGSELRDLSRRIQAGGFRIVFFQKVHGPEIRTTVRELASLGIATIFGVCDVVEPAMVEACDSTIAVTHYLRGLYPASLRSKIHVVHDGIENARAQKVDWSGDPQGPLRAVLVTSSRLSRIPVLGAPPDWMRACIVGDYPHPSQYLTRLREMGWTIQGQSVRERLEYLGFLMNPRIRRVPWDPHGVYERMSQADVGIIPVEATPGDPDRATVPSWKVKSENRLTMKMSMALPVIASPIPAYESVIRHRVNGFFARSLRDWHKWLSELRDPDLRREIGLRARQCVIERYSKEEQARRLIAVIAPLIGQPVVAAGVPAR